MDTTALSLCMDNRSADLRLRARGRQHPPRRRTASASAPSSPPRPPEQTDDDRRVHSRRDPADGQVRRGRAARVQHAAHRAAPRAALLDRIQIDYYGTKTPLKQLATINAPEPRLLTVQPFDPSSSADDRADDPGVRPRPDAVERRQDHPPADPAADRGAPQGARQGRAADGGGRTRRGPRTSAATSCTT